MLLPLLNLCTCSGFCLCASKFVTSCFQNSHFSNSVFQTLYKDSCQECPGCCVKEDWGYPSATKWQLRNFPNKTWNQKKKTLCLLPTKVCRSTKLSGVASEFCTSQEPAWSTLWRPATCLWCLLPKMGDEDACMDPSSFWTGSSQIALIGVEFEVQKPGFNFLEIRGVQLQGFYLSLSLAWLQVKGEQILQARSLQMQKIIGFKMSLAERIMDILRILRLAVVFCWLLLPSWCDL